LPPGTGDVPLTVMQSLPVKGIIMVTSPQELVGMIVKKAVKMAEAMKIPILGIIENMSYVLCPHCGERYDLFGKSRVAATAEEMGLKYLGALPMDSELVSLCDEGKVEYYNSDVDTVFTSWLEE
jgi:Mrp family chromosome partitioning ATPase